MRRFFQTHRSEDYSQIQYLTAKCTRLVHDRAVLERDFLLGLQRERKLQSELEAARVRLLGQERLNLELRARQGQLLGRMQQQQELLDVLLAEESCRDGELLRRVGSELLSLHSSELRPGGLVRELRTEAQRRASPSESLRSELHSKMVELQELQGTNRTLTEELQCLRAAYQKESIKQQTSRVQHRYLSWETAEELQQNQTQRAVGEVSDMQQENQASVGKLQQTVEQCEWLCQQQRHWMLCARRFKESLVEERGALLPGVSVLERKAAKMKLRRDVSAHSDSGTPWWDDEAQPDSQVEKSNTPRRELCDQTGVRDGKIKEVKVLQMTEASDWSEPMLLQV